MQSNSTPPPPTIRGNSGSFENKGLEGVVKVAFNEHSRWHVNYTYIDSDRPVLYTPGHKLFTSFNQRIIGGLRANLSLNYVGGLYTQLASQNASAIKEDYLLLNAGLKYNAIPDYLDVYLRVKNILNTEYQMIPGYDMPAAHFDMGLKFRLQ